MKQVPPSRRFKGFQCITGDILLSHDAAEINDRHLYCYNKMPLDKELFHSLQLVSQYGHFFYYFYFLSTQWQYEEELFQLLESVVCLVRRPSTQSDHQLWGVLQLLSFITAEECVLSPLSSILVTSPVSLVLGKYKTVVRRRWRCGARSSDALKLFMRTIGAQITMEW